MKKMLTLLAAGLLLSTISYGQKDKSQEPIIETIKRFAASADQQDAVALDGLLDANFRVIMNQMFGSEDVLIMDKKVYLQKIKDKEFGGEEREITIENIAVLGKTASAKVSFKGSKLTFVSFLQLVQDSKGSWKLINDMPTVI
jgi:hypothetical protein